MATDVHQHLWGGAFIDALRGRTETPRLDGWTLHLDGEAPFDADPADHDLSARAALAASDGFSLVLTSLSSPLGIEWLAPSVAGPLLEAYHEDALALPAPFGAWAAASVAEIDAPGLASLLDRGLVGLQLPANALSDAAGYGHCAPLLELLESRGLPLFVHPGPAPSASGPAWWPALVPYVQQMHAAWFAFRAWGRPRFPRLRVCFALLSGLAPLHGERLAVRGGGRGEVDRDVFLETSSYGPRAIDATIRALGIDTIVCGSDRPYAPPPGDLGLGEAAEHAIRVANPGRLLMREE
ncbi:amidohydrolase family protein [Actinomadura sp. DC4]|uniref:amidohydrolase family protein n=1 Tax=Actinomadura sp. DC4 TaxID=3055069 RepID=UPI0025B1073D|nr:amidohydrolase family protein [Actinomadura sp. DC4]MDN3356935.1 amidohydrolase family protein [Actinomadura sp. DC4]